MSYLKKKSNKRLDFLPNINNKYSIRKFTVGTASILVGATLIFGVAHDERKQLKTLKLKKELQVTQMNRLNLLLKQQTQE